MGNTNPSWDVAWVHLAKLGQQDTPPSTVTKYKVELIKRILLRGHLVREEDENNLSDGTGEVEKNTFLSQTFTTAPILTSISLLFCLVFQSECTCDCRDQRWSAWCPLRHTLWLSKGLGFSHHKRPGKDSAIKATAWPKWQPLLTWAAAEYYTLRQLY